MLRVAFVLVVLAVAGPVQAQSLFTEKGDRAVEASVGWSVGPASNGVETILGMSLDGRTDVGVWISRYTLDFGGGFKTSFMEFNDRWFMKFTAEERSFRRETYRSARIAIVGRL